MANFENALHKVLAHEGGYVNDPDDAGGETYKGVARKIFSKWDGWTIVDLCKKKPNFPKNLDLDTELQHKIEDFYRVNFWDRVKGDDIKHEEVAFAIFDFGVNAGVSTSAVLAQKVLDLDADGVIGNGTVTALNEQDPERFLASFTLAKIARYIYIVNKKPSNKKFFFGWVNRAINS